MVFNMSRENKIDLRISDLHKIALFDWKHYLCKCDIEKVKFLRIIEKADIIWCIDGDNFSEWVIAERKSYREKNIFCPQKKVIKKVNSIFHFEFLNYKNSDDMFNDLIK